MLQFCKEIEELCELGNRSQDFLKQQQHLPWPTISDRWSFIFRMKENDRAKISAGLVVKPTFCTQKIRTRKINKVPMKKDDTDK